MKKLNGRIGAVLISGILLAAGTAVLAHDTNSDDNRGWESGAGYGMHHRGHGWGMMGHGQGHHADGRHGYGRHQERGMGPGGGWRALPEDLTVDQVRHMLEHELHWSSSDDLKVGKVEESGDNRIIAEIVDEDGSVVRRYEINLHTGARKLLS